MGRLLVVLGFIALAVLAFLCVNKHTPGIEDDLVMRTQASLAAESIEFTKVGIDGRDVTLTGIAPDEVSRERANVIASAINGVRSVNNQITLSRSNSPTDRTHQEVTFQVSNSDPISEFETPLIEVKPLDTPPARAFPVLPAAYETEIKQNEGHVTLSGMVPDESAKLWLRTKTEQQFGEGNVSDLTKVVYGAKQGWHGSVSAVLENISYLQDGKASLKDTELLITGSATSTRIFDQIRTSISEGLSDNYGAEFDIKVAEPDLIPAYVVQDPKPLNTKPAKTMPKAMDNYQTEIIYDSKKVILKGHVPDQSARVWLNSLAVNVYGKENVIDSLTVAKGATQDWYPALSTSLKYLSLLNKGKASLNNSDLIVSGQASSAENKTKIEKAIDESLTNADRIDIKYDLVLKGEKTSDLRRATAYLCQQKINKLLKNKQILFDSSKADINSESHALLDSLVKVVKKDCSKNKIEIAGHTDNRGDDAYNQYLSELRAKSVVKYMQEKGVTSSNLKAVGYGERRPIVENSTPEGMTKNRRIEFNVQGK